MGSVLSEQFFSEHKMTVKKQSLFKKSKQKNHMKINETRSKGGPPSHFKTENLCSAQKAYTFH
jgi:hypothetical protein